MQTKLKEKKKQRIAEGEEGTAGGAVGKGGGKSGSLVDAGDEAAVLWAKFCKVRGDLVTPLELDRAWVTAGSLARVDGFGAHTLVKLAGFIKGE